MFDLDERIRQWRQTLGGALGGRPEVVDELESHLREEMHRLVQSGQAPEPAWETALGRLGDPRQLAAEFARVPPPGRTDWLPARLVLIAQVAFGALLGGWLLSKLRDGTVRPLLAGHVFLVAVGYAATFAVGALAVWSVFTRALGRWDGRRARALRSAAWWLTASGLGLTAVGVALGCWWARDNLGRYWAWDPKEIGGVGVLAWDGLMLLCLWRLRAGGRAEMLLGVAGNAVVSLSWFGANLLAVPHAYGFGTGASLLVGFVVLQMLILGIAFVPTGRLARPTT